MKLVRKVTTKKVSNMNENGEVKWIMREVTILTCPGSNLSQPVCEESELPALSMTYGRGTNKKQRIFDEKEMIQSQTDDPVIEIEADIPLDKTS